MSFIDWCSHQFSRADLAGVLFSTSICFDVSVFEVFAPLCTGGTLIVADDLLSVGTLPARERVRIVSSTTAGLAEIVRAGTLPRSVRIVMQAGEYLPRAIANEILASGVATLYNLCGATEDTVYSTISKVSPGDPGDPPIGLPFENRKAYVLDRQLRPVPAGIPGELFYAGPGVAREYFRRPDLTRERFLANPFARGEHDRRLYRSGDLVRRRADGELIHLGRLDQQVKIRGFRIELAEIESVVAMHPQVFESAVAVRPNARGENELVAYVVARREAPVFAELRTFIGARLPNYMLPSALVVLRAMPRSPSGKLDRAALPAPERAAGSGASPSTRIETTLQTIWRDLLAVEEVGVDDNFFVLGGHSLLAARMIARAEAVFMRTELMGPFIASPTIRTLAERIETELPPAPLPSIVKINAPLGGAPPLFFLHGMFAGDGFYVWNVVRHLPKTFGLYAVHPYGNDGTAPPETIEAMASAHLREIRALQPHGPYRLGGFCNGGLIAYEMACKLRAEGETVDRLVIVAANALNLRTRMLRDVIAAAARAARAAHLPSGFESLVYERVAGYAKQLRDLVYDPFLHRWRNPAQIVSAASKLQRIRRERLAADGIGAGRFDRTYEKAVLAYFPRAYDGELQVVVGASSTVEGSEDPTLGWSAVTSRVSVIRIPGGHHAVEEHPENFAAILTRWP